MPSAERGHWIAGLRLTSLGTLVSRVLGLLRDMAIGALFGLASGGVLDSFTLALRVPNLFRRLFGEGALSASYLPVLARQLHRDPRGAAALAAGLFGGLTLALTAMVLAGELLLGVFWWLAGEAPRARLAVGLTAVMLPYVILVCLAAQATATLHALGRFGVPSMVPWVLNAGLLVGAWWLAPKWSADPAEQAYVLAGCVLAAGVVQVLLHWPPLRQHGFGGFRFRPYECREQLREVVAGTLPVAVGLAVTQLNTLTDSLLAWTLSRPPGASGRVAWLGHRVAYPMEQGAAAAVYYGERLYQFPLGIIGLAVATAIFPLLARHAANDDRRALGADLTLGLQLVLLLTIPAGVGLVLLAEPLARLLFEHGRFTAADTARTARLIACYGVGVAAYCAAPVLVRGFYALGDRMTPLRVAVRMVAVNLALNLVLIWPLAEAGLAVSTVCTAVIQVVVLMVLLVRRCDQLNHRAVARTLLKAVLATAGMAAAVWVSQQWLGAQPGRLLAVAVPVGFGGTVYLAGALALGCDELSLLSAGRGAADRLAAMRSVR